MAKISLDYSDGRYLTQLLTAEEVAKHEELDLDVVHLEDSIWEAYLRHCDQDATWQVLWRSISNEQYTRRRARELMPLEDAAREIERLKEELARAKRMEKFYEGQYAENLHVKHRTEYAEYTCVYPTPGCDVEMLPSKWRERAWDILEQYREEDAAEGIKRQGCCCGHEHVKLDEATAEQLRTKGFIVEHDTEVI